MANQATDNRTLISTGEAVTNWEDITGAGAVLDTEISYNTYTGSIGEYATTTRAGTFYDNGSSGLFLGGDHAYILFNCGIVSLLDTKANGGVTIRVTGTSISDWAEIEIAGSDDYPTAFEGGWVQFVVDIDELIANPDNTNGTPPIVSTIQRIGITFVTASVMPRMADNCWVGGLFRLPANTPAIIVEGRDGGTDDWNFSRVASVAAVELSAVLRPGPGGSFVCRGPIQIGINDTTTHEFTSTNETLLWDSQQVMLDGFYGLSALGNSGGTTNVTFGLKTGTGNDATGSQGGVIQADSGFSRWDMDFDDPNLDRVDFYGASLIHGGTFQLDDAAVDIASTTMVDCSKAHFSNAKVVRLSVVAPNTLDGVAFCDTDDLGDIAFGSFEFSDGHGVEILSGGPATQNNIGNVFLGSFGGTPGDNLVASSGSNDAMIYNNSGAAKTFNRSDGGTQPSFRNGASATSDDEASINLTFTPLIAGSDIAVFAAGSNTPITDNDSSGTSFVASVGAGQNIDYKIYAAGYQAIEVYNVSFAASQNVLVNQQVDRNYDEVA